MLPVEAVGSPEYFARILEDCNLGCQRCFECHVLSCHDNLHPARVAGLERAIIDFHELEFQLRAKIKRLHELNESSTTTTRRHQTDKGKTMNPKERWGEIKRLTDGLYGATKPDGGVVDLVIEHVRELDKLRARTVEDLIFSESDQLNRAADFECTQCGAALRVTEVQCGECEDKSLADEQQNTKQMGLPWGEVAG